VGQQQHHETNTDGARKQRGSLPIQPQFISSLSRNLWFPFISGRVRSARFDTFSFFGRKYGDEPSR
jgi:hypothetical protein